ncbi:ester cyclase [Vitiosangium sp. GDMCC 1.1324]|uniref:ester cyclase n=1 Tax=Vitiosangium sp. (strain GDMCC 1.1324) TaxID=2138576 RepID=UPI000D3C80FF|nr:ester cyclase [Vitiosangium sp. GDMCC 1.1324]PTL84164.1 ester cyclase [Vitiosangium sp. GDMCC 1.1324]
MPSLKTRLAFRVIAAALVTTSPALAEEPLPQPREVIVGKGLSPAAAEERLLPARRYYAFWNTGKEQFAKEALAPDFVDLNLPEGRPQGVEGPLTASRAFRQAVPDLSVSVERAWVVNDQVISQLRFTGHFTGRFGDKVGDGRTINFSAVDIYTLKNGRIATNWHLEDNLSLMKQLGVISTH